MPSNRTLFPNPVEGTIDEFPKDQINALARNRDEYQKIGWLYALDNPAFKEQLMKIGETFRPPNTRAQELSQPTGIPSDFRLIHYVHVSNRHEAERYVHSRLSPSRYRDSREFFKVSIPRVVEVFEKAADRFPLVLEIEGEKKAVDQKYGQARLVRCGQCGEKNKIHSLCADHIRFRCARCGHRLHPEKNSG